jgi:hypothetical protein
MRPNGAWYVHWSKSDVDICPEARMLGIIRLLDDPFTAL